jgi:hypothetical protein
LIHYHRAPGLLNWLGVMVTGLLGWFAHPVLLALLMPLFLIYYISVGVRHRLPWHIALLGGLLTAMASNAFWLMDWVSYWWIRAPFHLDEPLLAHRTLRTLWEASLWGCPVDRGLACGMAIAAALGVLLYNENCQRATARLLGMGWAGFMLLAMAGVAWEPLGRLGAARLVVPALLFATLPAAHTVGMILHFLRTRTGTCLLGPLVTMALLAGTYWSAAEHLTGWAQRLRGGTPMTIGLGPSCQALVAAIQDHTTKQARILWEDRCGARLSPHWTALLPVLTDRSYMGGLDPQAGIEYTTTGFVDQVLAGKPLADWTDAELHEYCERYNIGWVVCWSKAAQERFAAWPEAGTCCDLPDADHGCLFPLTRPANYALVGSAEWLSADPRRLILGNLTPKKDMLDQEGQVLLSLHYQAGMRVAPSRVRLEPAEVAGDAIPLVRLRVNEPVARITITWEKR